MAETKKAPSASSVGGTDLYWLGAVVAIVLGTVCVLVFAPDATIEKLFRLLEKLPAEVWGGIATAVVGTIVAIVRSRNGGGGPPAAGVLGLLGVLALSATLTGCGTNAYRVQYDAINAAAEITAGASETVYAATAAEIHEDCAPTLDSAAFQLCAQGVATSWRPAQTGVGSLRLGLGTWYEGVRIAEVHGADPGELALQGAAALVRSYAELVELLAPHGIELPPLPEVVVAIARGVEVD